MTTTNAELIATAAAFKAVMSDAETDALAPGSILGLWLRTADALVAATSITEERVELVARVLAQLEPGESWPSNESLGGTATGTRDDEYRDAKRDEAREVLIALSNPEEAP